MMGDKKALYFLVTDSEGRTRTIHLDRADNTDEVYNLLSKCYKQCGLELRGMFGTESHARLWHDYYNNTITREELREGLGLK